MMVLMGSAQAAETAKPSLVVKTFFDQPSVNAGEKLNVKASILNQGSADVSYSLKECYWSNWVVDNPQVSLDTWKCREMLKTITRTLKPRETDAYKLRVFIPDKKESGWVTFRLGFLALGGGQPLWSEPMTVEVKVDRR